VRVKGSQHIHEESKHSSGSLAGIPRKDSLGLTVRLLLRALSTRGDHL